jgi:hypothetical protein
MKTDEFGRFVRRIKFTHKTHEHTMSWRVLLGE